MFALVQSSMATLPMTKSSSVDRKERDTFADYARVEAFLGDTFGKFWDVYIFIHVYIYIYKRDH